MLQLLLELANKAGVKQKIDAMFAGEHINSTEDRAVLHVALRAPRGTVIHDAGQDVVPEVWKVLDKIKAFSGEMTRSQRNRYTSTPPVMAKSCP